MVLHHETHATRCNSTSTVMAIEIQGTVYYAANEIMEELGISRQTLWRWRRAGKIPRGHRFRDGKVMFTDEERDAIRQFANRIEPITETERDQLKLF